MSDLFLLSPAQMSKIAAVLSQVPRGRPGQTTGALCQALFTSSNMVCSGRMRQRLTVRTRRSTIVSGAGPSWVFSTESSVTWQPAKGLLIR